jgi:hypothetical protein
MQEPEFTCPERYVYLSGEGCVPDTSYRKDPPQEKELSDEPQPNVTLIPNSTNKTTLQKEEPIKLDVDKQPAKQEVAKEPQTYEVDLKINGEDGPITLTKGESIEISWTTQGNFTRCESRGFWHGYHDPSGGSESFNVYMDPGNYDLLITCNSKNSISNDYMQTEVIPSTNAPVYKPGTQTTPMSTIPSLICDGGYDSDGFDIFRSGYVTKKDGSMIKDSCINKWWMKEGVCINGCNCEMLTTLCPLGYKCSDGACMPRNKAGVDSDNKYLYSGMYASLLGINIFEKGTTSINYPISGTLVTSVDECQDSNTVKENFIFYSEYVKNKIITCPQGSYCSNGACTQSTTCHDLIGANRPYDKSRINIVFVGTGFDTAFPNKQVALTRFRETAKNVREIFLTFKPFDEMQNYFNFWYVDSFIQDNPPPSTKRISYLIDHAQAYTSACNYNKKIVVNLMADECENTAWTSEGLINLCTNMEDTYDDCVDTYAQCLSAYPDQDGDGCLSQKEDYPNLQASFPLSDLKDTCMLLSSQAKLCPNDSKEKMKTVCSISGPSRTDALAHELGHFAGMTDENTGKSPDTIGAMNCYIADSVDACYQNAPWKSMIGQGCGDSNELDCTESDPGYSNEIGCYEGCSGRATNSYRYMPVSEMMYGVGTPDVAPSRSFGVYGEMFLRGYFTSIYNN